MIPLDFSVENEGDLSQIEEEELEQLIREYIDGRKIKKIEAAEDLNRKGKLGDGELEEERQNLEAKYAHKAWIENAAQRSSQIRVATHIAKGIHPDSKASSLQAKSGGTERWAGTPSAASNADVIGNAAAMDVTNFLFLVVAGVTVGERLMSDDSALMNVLRRLRVDPAATKKAFSSTFAAPKPAADTWLKQVYFPLGGDDAYHLLAPLYPSSLVNEVHSVVREARFGESAKEARKARREDSFYEPGLVEYPNLVLEMFGSGKPQNVSVLTKERRGEAYHFPSCPPAWDTGHLRPLWGTRTVFQRVYPRMARRDVKALSTFLDKERRNNVDLRAHRASLVGQLVDGLLYFAMGMQSLDAGWTADPRCELELVESLWLDPGRVELDAEFAAAHDQRDWRREVADRFARWLNKELSRVGLPVGDAEHREWRDEVLDALDADIEIEEEADDTIS